MIDAITNYFGGPLGRMELIATLLLIVNVYLLGRQRLSNFIFGLAGVVLFGFLFKASRLYSDMLLQWVFYAPLQVVGFVMWKYGRTLGSDQPAQSLDSMRVVWLERRYWAVVIAVVLVMTLTLGFAMATWTDASYPYPDALTTSLSVVASILMLKKIIENWILWIVMNMIAIPIYWLKDLYVTAGLYVVFLMLATFGFVQWVRDYQALAARAPAR
ncbi:MAG: nicotinamide riboside transporter PnuC [Pseudomonadota bacterium]